MNKKKVGIVMLSYNRADVTILCLKSLSQAKTEIPFEIFILDNASRMEEYRLLKSKSDELFSAGTIRGVLERSEVNTGFPKGNNIGIRRFLEKKDVTHICLLNNDVVVTDYWLDRLLNRDVSAVGPVTNACGNEQTIPVPYAIRVDDEGSMGIVSNFARTRYRLFSGCTEKTDWLGFFCFIATKDLFNSVGLLDERFGRGGFEDDDYCIRLMEKGYEMSIARDVFIHHWGTASFTQIPLPKLMKHIESNRKIFEAKYGRPWKDRKWLPMKSFRQDMDFLLKGSSDCEKREIFDLYFSNTEQLVKNIVSAEREVGGSWLSSGALIRKVGTLAPIRVIKKSFKLLFSGKNVVFLVRYPKGEDLNDGYFQRVNSIDSVLSGRNRIYVDYCRIPYSLPRVVKIREGVWEVRLSGNNPLHLLFLSLVVALSGRVYLHSVLRLRSMFHRALFLIARQRVLDVHGVVPEEFRFHGDDRGYAEYNKIELFGVRFATKIVCVTDSMAAHIRKKYNFPSDDDRFILLPIFQEAAIPGNRTINREKMKPIIYCGGLQKWQQLDKMLEYVRRHATDTVFTFLVPDPNGVRDRFRELFGEDFPGTVVSACSEEVLQYYSENRFGLVLREDVIVNRVACPTKLTEYLQHDIVPIVDLEEIGDFKGLGYRFIRYDEELPNEAARMEMVLANRSALESLRERYLEGAERLRKAL